MSVPSSTTVNTMNMSVLERMSFNCLILFLFVTLYNGMIIFPLGTRVYHSVLSRETEPTDYIYRYIGGEGSWGEIYLF